MRAAQEDEDVVPYRVRGGKRRSRGDGRGGKRGRGNAGESDNSKESGGRETSGRGNGKEN